MQQLVSVHSNFKINYINGAICFPFLSDLLLEATSEFWFVYVNFSNASIINQSATHVFVPGNKVWKDSLKQEN